MVNSAFSVLAHFWAWPISSVLLTPRKFGLGSTDYRINERLEAQGLLGSHFGYIGQAKSYDYVVVGGGTAGLTVARRLAQKHTVAVIEAGSFYEFDSGNLTETPADASYYLGKEPLFQNPLIDWRQMTTP
jgi:hypothetical protein